MSKEFVTTSLPTPDIGIAILRGSTAVLKLMIVLIVGWLAACGDQSSNTSEHAREPVRIALNNRGVAQMGRFDYPAAVSTFTELSKLAPEWPLAQVNLAIATLNRQNPGDEAAALALLSPLLAGAEGAEISSEQLARASFIAGILHFNQGLTDSALQWFEQAAQLAPDDAYAHYFHGQVLLQQGQADLALQRFQRAGQLNGYLRSAFYGQFLAHQRLRQRDLAREQLAIYERLDANPRSQLAEIKYTRMGPLAMAQAISPDLPQPFVTQSPAGPLFAQSESIMAGIAGIHASVYVSAEESLLQTHMTVVAGDEIVDCSLSGCEPLNGPGISVAASAWADMDNSGQADRLLLGAGSGLWIEYNADGQWSQVLADDPQVTSMDWQTLLVVDADHDGDLDIIVSGTEAPALLISNNGNGTFRRLDGYMPAMIEARQVVSADLDQDRDQDLLLISAGGRHQVLLNDRLWRYTDAGDSFAPWQQSPTLGVALVDLDVDGQLELLSLNSDALVIWQESQAGWQIESTRSHNISEPDRLWIQDFSGDGSPEALVAGAQDWSLLSLNSKATLAAGAGRVLAPLLGDFMAGPGLLLADESELRYLPPGSGRWPFVTLALTGLTDTGQAMRSNASGLGTRVIMRGASRWQSVTTPAPSLSPGQNLQPLSVGLGGEASLASITLDWSDGVFQSELDLKPGLHSVSETQRQLASCPVLFQWDGEDFQFVTDVLGVGGMGFNTGFGQYAQPRPRESLLLTPASDQEQSLRLLVAEPMEESAYMDYVSVSAVDYPQQFQPLLDERMATDGNQPSGELFWIRHMLAPIKVVNDRGVDVTASVLQRDLDAAPMPPVEPQLAGLLTRPQILTLTFDRDLSNLGSAMLIFDGWVEYGYSQTSFAAWQQGRGYDAVSLDIEVPGPSGMQWVSWRPSFGYPAGMPRAATLPLASLPDGVRQLRLTTHQQIYFDRLAVAETVMPDGVKVTPLTLTSASVRHVGFPRRSNGPQMQPNYDFSTRDAYWDTRYQRGEYTALGPVEPLLASKDNALAIIGPGDGLQLDFHADIAPVLPTHSRRWLVTFHGWAKDMDLYTDNGDTLLPLPVNPMLSNPRTATLHEQYNTRFRSGR